MFETLFYQPILNLLIWLYDVIPGQDLGIAIILLTIIIKILLYSLNSKQIKSQKELQELQPKIEEVKNKYKDSKEEMGKKMMELYKEHKVNPFGSCLPLLIQMPFLFALFRVFRDGFEDGALKLIYPFIHNPETINYISFGFLDLSKKNIYIAILAALAQFWQAKMMMSKKTEVKGSDSKNEDMAAIMNKQMVYFMPVMTFFMASSFSAGLALYWLVTTLLSAFQQLYILKKKNNPKSKIIEGELIS
ncbi:YidC/Oxa1 family membrane protein insertase [Candidatus Parcubacteria bacterium]|nr:YidC/Oxa1 family membrane protein insertase [Patescibacteria group bacterium]MBU4309699.1 YidC/Oxa1 family membrane protein insertase [Patescibacteria group bacterium]MBU4431677.1 YidC/Oxa1 family membrane protein insertase [Patescibacteria group bacterium]MBU4577913.1 YidC/Oxa1 family membrane protein insertase [Patescibacteria group bacterium]MCG2696577.1 YidC/Oxa1 family membrane protein insertase [Candidatus Parcubacteria bacterium]